MNKLKYISASQLTLFEDCPRKWWATYILKMKQPQHIMAKLGSIVHKILEVSLTSKIKKIDSKLNNPLNLIDYYIKKYNVPSEHIEEFKTQIFKIINNSKELDYFNEKNLENTELEKKLKIKINNVSIIGYIDRLDNLKNPRVIDLKTNKNAYSADELFNNWQSKIYAIPFLEQEKKVTVEFWFLRLKQIVKIERKPSELPKIKEKIESLAEGMKNCNGEKFKINRYCNWCVYKNKCNDYKGGK